MEERINWIDWVKAWCMTVVVFEHTPHDGSQTSKELSIRQIDTFLASIIPQCNALYLINVKMMAFLYVILFIIGKITTFA